MKKEKERKWIMNPITLKNVLLINLLLKNINICEIGLNEELKNA